VCMSFKILWKAYVLLLVLENLGLCHPHTSFVVAFDSMELLGTHLKTKSSPCSSYDNTIWGITWYFAR
jgi:hypothetical protein